MNIDETFKKYNEISAEKIDLNKMQDIIEKMNLILSKVNLDNVELIELIDTLLYFKKLNLLFKINEETIDFIVKITKNELIDLEGTLYFSVLLKHILLPYNVNKCDNEYNLMLFLSEFEIIIELFDKLLETNDFKILIKYNLELGKIVLQYKKIRKLYKNKKYNILILRTMYSHLLALFYFNQEKYNSNYDLIDQIINSMIYNYQDFINYCYNEHIYNNFSKLFLKPDEMKKEYLVCQNMLDYTCDYMKNKKIKGKC